MIKLLYCPSHHRLIQLFSESAENIIERLLASDIIYLIEEIR